MFRLTLVGLAFTAWLLWTTTARAEWRERQSQSEPSIVPGIVHQHLVMSDSVVDDEATLELARFSPKAGRLRLIDNSGGQGDLASAMKTGNYVGGVNGGYFDENFAPLGLRIDDGKMRSPLVRGRLLSGVVVASDSGIRILRSSEFGKSNRASAALQCGPFLIDHGRAVSGLNSSKPARRTFVAITNKNEVALGHSSEVSLQQLAAILGSLSADLKIDRALNLDGGSSSAFWFKRQNGSALSISEQKSVRDFIGVEPK